MYKIIEERNSEQDVIADNVPTLETAIETCLDEAESNGYVPGTETREELETRLKSDKGYTDGDVTIRILLMEPITSDDSEMMKVKASELRTGDMVDLDGGDFFQDNPAVEFELGIVCDIVPETDNCILVHFDLGSAGYDPNHVFKIKRRDLVPEGWYDKFA